MISLAAAALLLLSGIPGPAFSAGGSISGTGPAALRTVRLGALLGLDLARMPPVARRPDPGSGQDRLVPLSDAQQERVERFLSRLPDRDPERAMALALRSYLKPRMDPRELGDNLFIRAAPGGFARLTAAGKAALADVLLAEDGDLLDAIPVEPREKTLAGAPAEFAGGLTAVRRSAGALSDPHAAFDGRRPLPLPGFDWDALRRETARRLAGTNAALPSALDGYAVDHERGTVRVLIAAKRAVKEDRLGLSDSRPDQSRIYKETGLDRGLMDRSGARVVRAVDNLVAVDLPVSQAARLGKALERRGILSVPARMLYATAASAAASPAAALLGGQFLPMPARGARRPAPSAPAGLRGMLGVEALEKAGMQGRGAAIGFIDSGLDSAHPDFRGRIREEDYADFTNEGKNDSIGHGTFLSGLAAGSGEASQGRYRGMAPLARLVVAKIFDAKGEASEDTLLAAMKWMEGRKPDVVNISMAAPGVPNRDPVGAMANRMMIQDNILVAASAGNRGPIQETVSVPGSSRYVLTVTGVNQEGRFPYYPSRGPVREPDGGLYNKPDVAAVAGDFKERDSGAPWARAPAGPGGPAPASPRCQSAAGVIAARSSRDPDPDCALAGDARYRFFSGTSMAAPMAAGMAGDVAGFVREKGLSARAIETKAALMETARDLGAPRETQGAGLIDGRALAGAVADRVERGLPIGNVAYALALRMLAGPDLKRLKSQSRFVMTGLGLWDSQAGHLVNSEREMARVVGDLRRLGDPPAGAIPSPAPYRFFPSPRPRD